MNGRHFVFSSGIGLDASVVERVDAHPRRKARFGAWYYSYAAVGIFNRRYLIRPPHVRVLAGGRELEGVTVIVQNSDPFTYFRRRPIRVAEGAGLQNGSLSLAVLRKATLFELPTLIPRLLSGRDGAVARHRQVVSLPVPRDRAGRVHRRHPVPGSGGRRLHRRARVGGVPLRPARADGRVLGASA